MRSIYLLIPFIAYGLFWLYSSDPEPYPNRSPELMEPAKKDNAFLNAIIIEPEAASGFEEKPAVHSDEMMVVTAHPAASKAAREILKTDGNALDATIAAQMMLNLVEPQSSGIGGGGFLLYYDAATKQLTAYDGRETSPAAFDPESFLKTVDINGTPTKVKQSFKQALQGSVSVGTPGLLAMLDKAHRNHGKAKWQTLFAPAIAKAKNGFTITPRLMKLLDYAPNMHENFSFKEGYVAQHYEVGNHVTNPALSQTFEAISQQGIAAFYTGDIAQHIVEAVQKETPSGALSLVDISDYRALKTEALCTPYRTYEICSPPPPSGGVTLQQITGMLQHFPMGDYDANSVTGWHLLAEATKLAFGDRAYVGDISAMEITTDELLNPAYLKSRIAEITENTAIAEPRHGDIIYLDPPSTTHLSIVDVQGNIATMTTSIEHAFGSGGMVDGFFLNNQLTDFDWQIKHGAPISTLANLANSLKRPRSSMSPTIVFDNKKRPILVIGSPGGSRIIPYIAKTLVATLDWNMPLDSALTLPHIISGSDGKIAYEPSTSVEIIHALKAMGHAVYERELTSGLHAIHIQYEGEKATYIGAADPRREGVALSE